MNTRLALVVTLATAAIQLPTTAAQQPNPRQQPGAPITVFAPEQHDLYDGHFVISANRVHMVGGLNDPPGWDHMDNDAKTVKPVSGTAEIDVECHLLAKLEELNDALDAHRPDDY